MSVTGEFGHAGLRYGQAPALLTSPEAQQIFDAVASCLDIKGGTRLASATGECLGYLLEMLARLAKAPPPGALSGSCFGRFELGTLIPKYVLHMHSVYCS